MHSRTGSVSGGVGGGSDKGLGDRNETWYSSGGKEDEEEDGPPMPHRAKRLPPVDATDIQRHRRLLEKKGMTYATMPGGHTTLAYLRPPGGGPLHAIMRFFGVAQRGSREPRLGDVSQDVQGLSKTQVYFATKFSENPKSFVMILLACAALEIISVLLFDLSREGATNFKLRSKRQLHDANFTQFDGVEPEDITFSKFPTQPEYAIVQGIIGVIFNVQYLTMLVVSTNRLSFIVSIESLIQLLTAIPSALQLANLLHGADDVFWVPVYLRIWWARYYIQLAVSLIKSIRGAVAEIISNVSLLVSILISSVGTYQTVEMITNDAELSFFETLYFMVVTFSTMGYGDYFPTTREGMVVIIIVIFVGTALVPTIVSQLTDLLDYLAAKNKYTDKNPHVVIAGKFTTADVKVICDEFATGPKKFYPLNFVLVSSSPFDSQTRRLTTSSKYQSKVTLIEGDLLQRADIERCELARAEAVMLISPQSGVAQRPDYNTILTSVAIQRYEKALPQYLVLKRGMHLHVVGKHAWAVVERERMKYSLIGLGATRPGLIPLLINLVKTTETEGKPDPLSPSWLAQYRYALQMNIFQMKLPLNLDGKGFIEIARLLLLNFGVCALGVVDRVNKNVTINPSTSYLSRHTHELVIMCPGQRTMRQAATCIASDSTSRYAAARMNETIDLKEPVPEEPNPLFEWNGHVVLVDLCDTQQPHNLCPEEEVEQSQFQADDLMNMLSPMVKASREGNCTQFVLLSRTHFSKDFNRVWAAKNYPPIMHVYGSGASMAALEQCRIERARCVVLFTSIEGDSHEGDSQVLLVSRMVYGILKRHNVRIPVVLEVEDPGTLAMCEPSFRACGDRSLYEESYDNFSFAPSFIAGGAISSSMLDTALYQTFFSPYLMLVLRALIFGSAGGESNNAAGDLSPAHCPIRTMPITLVYDDSAFGTGAVITYGDVFSALCQSRKVLIGLHRLVTVGPGSQALKGERFMFTNPHPSTNTCKSDILYFIEPES